MLTSQRFVSILATLASLCLSGCASIVSGRYADVHLDSHPSNAHVLVCDDSGHEVASVNTPAVVSLRRNRRFFLPARYTATFTAPGYKTTKVPLRSTINPWVTGNLVLGGPIGLVVDNATGAAWKPRHDQVSKHLTPLYAANDSVDGPKIDTAMYSEDTDSHGAEEKSSDGEVRQAAAVD